MVELWNEGAEESFFQSFHYSLSIPGAANAAHNVVQSVRKAGVS
jgi:hypothetical protein